VENAGSMGAVLMVGVDLDANSATKLTSGSEGRVVQIADPLFLYSA